MEFELRWIKVPPGEICPVEAIRGGGIYAHRVLQVRHTLPPVHIDSEGVITVGTTWGDWENIPII